MTEEWVDAVWEESIIHNIVSTDKMFDKYKCPPFYKLHITTSGLETKDREQVIMLINGNGIDNIYIFCISYHYLYQISVFFFRWEVYTSDEER